jgi:Crp-like helix-turn-helix domain
VLPRRWIVELGKYGGQDDGAGHLVLRHKISQGDLAAMAGVARENVSRVIADWKRNKVIARSSASTVSLTSRPCNAIWIGKPNVDKSLQGPHEESPAWTGLKLGKRANVATDRARLDQVQKSKYAGREAGSGTA